jgi:hypothetical protein
MCEKNLSEFSEDQKTNKIIEKDFSNNMSAYLKGSSVSKEDKSLEKPSNTQTEETEKGKKCSSKYTIVKIKKIINQIKKDNKKKDDNIKTLDFIKEIKYDFNVFYLIGGLNNSIYKYNQEYNYVSELNGLENSKDIYNVSEVNNNNGYKEITLNCVDSIYLYNIDLGKKKIKKRLSFVVLFRIIYKKQKISNNVWR